MNTNTIINRYIFRELIPPFVVSLMFFIFVFMMAKILDVMDLIVNYRLSPFKVLMFFIYSMPVFLQFVIPMAVMMCVLLAFLRMSGDNEIIALKAGGYNIYRLLPPVLLFSLLACLATGYITLYGLRWGTGGIKEMVAEVAATNIDIGLKEKTFNDSFSDITLYVEEIDVDTKQLKNVFIEDQRQRDKGIVVMVAAPEGRIINEPDMQVWQLKLKNGIINQASLKKRTVHAISFGKYTIRLDIRESALKDKAEGMGSRRARRPGQLIEKIRNWGSKKKDKKYWSLVAELHRRFSIPFACLALGFFAVSLGLQARMTRKSAGLGAGLAFFLVYYLLLSIGLVVSESGVCPPVIGMWGPNIAVIAAGVYLFKRVAADRPVRFDYFMETIRQAMRRARCAER